MYERTLAENHDRIVMTVNAVFDGKAKDKEQINARFDLLEKAKAMRRQLAEQIGEKLILDHDVGSSAVYDISPADMELLEGIREGAYAFVKNSGRFAGLIGDGDLRKQITDCILSIGKMLVEDVLQGESDPVRGTACTNW